MFYEFTTDTIEPINCWKDVWDVELLIGGSLFASIEDYSQLNREELLSKLTNDLQNDNYINNDAVQLSVSQEWLNPDISPAIFLAGWFGNVVEQ